MTGKPDLGHPLRLLAQGEVPRATRHTDVVLVHEPFPSAECGVWVAEYRSARHTASDLALQFRIPPSALRPPHSCHQNRHYLVRLRREPHDLPPPFEHERGRFALIGAHAMRALHAFGEAPR